MKIRFTLGFLAVVLLATNAQANHQYLEKGCKYTKPNSISEAKEEQTKAEKASKEFEEKGKKLDSSYCNTVAKTYGKYIAKHTRSKSHHKKKS